MLGWLVVATSRLLSSRSPCGPPSGWAKPGRAASLFARRFPRARESFDVSDPDRPTVFVLDDDLQVRKALARLLRSAGHTVETFISGREFLEREVGDRHACLVSDLRLPELDGLELFAMLRAFGRMTPIVFITGHGD